MGGPSCVSKGCTGVGMGIIVKIDFRSKSTIASRDCDRRSKKFNDRGSEGSFSGRT